MKIQNDKEKEGADLEEEEILSEAEADDDDKNTEDEAGHVERGEKEEELV